MSQNVQPVTFFALLIALVAGRAVAAGSVGVAFGSAVIEIPGALVLGRIALWLGEKLALFIRNVTNPETPKRGFSRSIWQTLSLSLVLGFPLWLLASQG